MDRDLLAIQETRDLVKKAKAAQAILERYSQEEVDRLVALMAEHGYRASRELAELACEETKMGRVESKIEKNQFATRTVYEYIKNIKTVGIIREDHERQVYEIATPMGIVAAIIPCTNPTSTAMCKILISVKARCTIILSPHPRAVKSVQRTAEIVTKAADSIGAPQNIVGCLTIPTLEATQDLMSNRDIGVILATGGSGLVKAAYSSGKPAIGVGPGNVPAFIERTANVAHAVRCLVASQAFDWGTICCSEQAVVFDKPIEREALEEFRKQKAYICNDAETQALEALMPPGNLPNPDMAGQSPTRLAEMAGFSVPPDTMVLLVWQKGVGDKYPLSREKLSPILALYTEDGWQAACERCMELLEYGGMGHSLVIHSRDREIIRAFAMAKPASRILVNSPSSQGGVGYGTGLVPSMTLGCGTPGGNITSDNITCTHLLNIKRLAFVQANWFKDIPNPQVSLGSFQEPSLIRRINPFDDIPGSKKKYYIGPHNNPNI